LKDLNTLGRSVHIHFFEMETDDSEDTGDFDDLEAASAKAATTTKGRYKPTKTTDNRPPPKRTRGRRHGSPAERFFVAVAEVFGDFSEVQEHCSNYQVVWKYLMDLLAYEVPGIRGDNPVCMKGLYSIPQRVVA